MFQKFNRFQTFVLYHLNSQTAIQKLRGESVATTLAIPAGRTMTKAEKGQRQYAANFWRWFNEERERRKLSYQDVEDAAKKSGYDAALTRGALQRAVSLHSKPDERAFLTVALAFNMPVWEVSSKTGLFGELPANVIDGNSTLAELISKARKMSNDELRVLIIAQNTIIEQRKLRPRS